MPHRHSSRWKNPDSEKLFRTVLLLKNLGEVQDFFRDLLTQPEIMELANRWKVAQMLDRGLPYTRIEKETGMSSTTIARIQWWVKHGQGGYQIMLKRLKRK